MVEQTVGRFCLLDVIQLLTQSNLPFIGTLVMGDLVYPKFASKHPKLLHRKLRIIGGLENKRKQLPHGVIEYSVVPLKDSTGVLCKVLSTANIFYSLQVPDSR